MENNNVVTDLSKDEIKEITDMIEKAKRTTVVNIKNTKADVYIGRGSKWGNPFKMDKNNSREDVIERYEKWIRGKPNLLKDLPELIGKKLGCFCAPKACHGDILKKLLIEQIDYELKIKYNMDIEDFKIMFKLHI